MAQLFQGHKVSALDYRIDHLRDIQYTTNGRIVSTGPASDVLYQSFDLVPVRGVVIGGLMSHFMEYGHHKIFNTTMLQQPWIEDVQKILLSGTRDRESYSNSAGVNISRRLSFRLTTDDLQDAIGLAFTVKGSNSMNFIKTIRVINSSRQAGTPVTYLNTIRISPARNLPLASNSSTRETLIDFDPDFRCTYHTSTSLSAGFNAYGNLWQGAKIILREAPGGI